MDVPIEHSKRRCYFIAVMFGTSMYSWCNYSLFDPIDDRMFTPYVLNNLLMLLYLAWDMLHMLTTPALFRTDLMIHHTITTVFYASYIAIVPLAMSNMLAMECVSLMNYAWRHHPSWLRWYRTLCIIGFRMPVAFWMWLYYNPTIAYPHFRQTLTYTHSLYLSLLGNGFLFFIGYDVFLLGRLYKGTRTKTRLKSQHPLPPLTRPSETPP
jgi:hypothetical protein